MRVVTYVRPMMKTIHNNVGQVCVVRGDRITGFFRWKKYEEVWVVLVFRREWSNGDWDYSWRIARIFDTKDMAEKFAEEIKQ